MPCSVNSRRGSTCRSVCSSREAVAYVSSSRLPDGERLDDRRVNRRIDLVEHDVDRGGHGVADGRLELGQCAVDHGELFAAGRGAQRTQRDDQRHTLAGADAQRAAHELRVADRDDAVVLERRQVEVDQLAGVFADTGVHQQPQVVADLLGLDAELGRDLVDRDAAVRLQVGHQGQHPHDLLTGSASCRHRPAGGGLEPLDDGIAHGRAARRPRHQVRTTRPRRQAPSRTNSESRPRRGRRRSG